MIFCVSDLSAVLPQEALEASEGEGGLLEALLGRLVVEPVVEGRRAEPVLVAAAVVVPDLPRDFGDAAALVNWWLDALQRLAHLRADVSVLCVLGLDVVASLSAVGALVRAAGEPAGVGDGGSAGRPPRVVLVDIILGERHGVAID